MVGAQTVRLVPSMPPSVASESDRRRAWPVAVMASRAGRRYRCHRRTANRTGGGGRGGDAGVGDGGQEADSDSSIGASSTGGSEVEPFTGQNSEAHSTPPRSAGSISIYIPDFSVENSPYPPISIFWVENSPVPSIYLRQLSKTCDFYALCINKLLFHTVRKE